MNSEDAQAPRPLSARSVVLSLLLGAHRPEMPVRDLVRAVAPFGVSEATLRVALTRMTAAGDLHRSAGTYRLSDRLLDRQRRQDEAVHPRTRPWDGDWEMAVVPAGGRGPAERAGLRAELSRLRLAELREGVWLRPANLRRTWPESLAPVLQRFTARPGQDPRELAARLWAPAAWAGAAEELLGRFTRTTGPAERFAAAAAIVRHLLTDPVLPAALLPPHWPAGELRAAYTAYQEEAIALGLGAAGAERA
ncbi:PaaX domain-containing protein, C- domain protein [Streptomyces sp. NBC_01476]|uniref:PaaX family transcriptional regulator C-terminal domain-containing protein n=1 Tax=Streptomyces sp. NBC_01476 TaxID=2903881 RepID=UPI002E36A8A2|nr:PaaX family transcriptional regulator C-terminal domain-containing protein [Streptomyces sp. NBC_01476]